jgi:hypothetical protein
MGFPNLFVMLFQDAAVRVNVNGITTQAFPIQQGVCQGHPLPSYLFLVIGEILNHSIKREVLRGRIYGIESLGAIEQQIIE